MERRRGEEEGRSSVKLQTTQRNLYNDKITVNGRPYRVDEDGVAEIEFEEDASKLLMLGWSDKVTRKEKRPVVAQGGGYKDGKAFLKYLSGTPDATEKVAKLHSFPVTASIARGYGFLLSTEEAFRADCLAFQKSDRGAAEDVWRTIPRFRPVTTREEPKQPTPLNRPTPIKPSLLSSEDEDRLQLDANNDDDLLVDRNRNEGSGANRRPNEDLNENDGDGENDDGTTGLPEKDVDPNEPPDPSMSMSKKKIAELADLYQVKYDPQVSKRDLVALVMKAMYPPDGKKT